jgi:predicted dehydrogenase
MGSIMCAGNWSRRGFLRQATAALTLGAGLPAWFAHEVMADDEEQRARTNKIISPNDRIAIGLIGTGSRGAAVLADLRKRGADVVAVCDVDRRHLQTGVEKAGGIAKAKGYKDFRDLLEHAGLDAVSVATPDHWHALIAIAALKKGKDVYCEHPLTYTLAEGVALRQVAHDTSQIFQVGSQQRSDHRFRLACELVRNGRIGKVKTVETRVGENPIGGPFDPDPIPDGLDWDFWQGPSAKSDYAKARCHYEFRWWHAYSGGKLTELGSHHLDIAQWGLGTDDTGPTSVDADGDLPDARPNCYDFPKHFKISYKYAANAAKYCDGTTLLCTSAGENGVKFIGENGSIFVSRGRIEASHPRILEEPLRDDAIRLRKSDDHLRNFLEGIKNRVEPICPPRVGHRSVSICHIGNIALTLRRALIWDPVAEKFEEDDEANAMLSREMRAPWKLDV